MKAKAQFFHGCIVERRNVVTHGTLNIGTGKTTEGRTETVVEPCGIPLFTAPATKDGVCSSCIEGWEAKGNAPTEKGREQIAAAKKARGA